MCAAAGIRLGQRALDVGCGSGALVARLAEVLGADNVAAVDPSEPFVQASRVRIPEARILVGSAESLLFGNGEFDATLSQLVVNFLDDPEQGLREMSRVTRADGIVAGCVWDYGGEMTMLRTFWEAAAALDPEGATPLMEAHTMRFARPDELASLWQSAGLRDVDVTPIVVEALYELRRPLVTVPNRSRPGRRVHRLARRGRTNLASRRVRAWTVRAAGFVHAHRPRLARGRHGGRARLTRSSGARAVH